MSEADSKVARRIEELEAELAELRASHAGLLTLVESVPDFVVRLDLDARFEFFNRVAPGLTREDVAGRTLYDFIEPEYHEVARTTLARVIATGQPDSFESVAVGARGALASYYSRVGPIRRDGKVVALTVIATDVTALKQERRMFAEHRDRLELAAEAAGLGYWQWDARGDVVHWDEATCKVFGVPPEQGLTTYEGFLDRVHPSDRERIRGEVNASVARGHYAGLQFRSVRPDGEERWVMTAGRVEHGADGSVIGLIGCVIDVTERRRLEEQLLQAQRLEAVGQLAAGVAHNFNNLLAALVPALELTTQSFPGSAPLLGSVLEAAERSAEVVRQLTAFAGGSRQGPVQASDAAAIARQVVQLSRAVIDRAIALDVVAPDSPCFVEVDGGALEQALMNLVLNARDALAPIVVERTRAARILVEVSSVPADPTDPKAPQLGWARIRVVDNGAGMREETRRRALEPFFTTKPPGRGTGLGLSTAYAMATSRGGRLRLDSTPGAGTEVTIEVPRGVAPAAPAREPRARGGHGERILLVDDEPAVRRVISTVLTEEGYRVHDVGDPLEALAFFEAAPTANALIIVDQSMPGLSGQALLDRILALAPATRAIAFSGGQDTPMIGARAHLPKPVSIRVVLATVRRVLDQP